MIILRSSVIFAFFVQQTFTLIDTCFCSNLDNSLQKPCHYGSKLIQFNQNREGCLSECAFSFLRLIDIASCNKGCHSESCEISSTKSWTTKIKSFFVHNFSHQISQSVYIIDGTPQQLYYNVYIDGKEVVSRNYETYSSNEVSYNVFMYSFCQTRTDFVVTLLAAMCFFIGALLLLLPFCEEGLPEEGKDGKGYFSRNIEAQDFHLEFDSELKKSLLEN